MADQGMPQLQSLLPLLAMLQGGGNQSRQPIPNAAPAFNSTTGGAGGGAAFAPSMSGAIMPQAASGGSNLGEMALLQQLMKGSGSGSSSGKGGGKGGGGLGGLLGGAGKGAGAGAGAGAAAGIGSDAIASYGPMLADIGLAADI